jgi:hypothetical protein
MAYRNPKPYKPPKKSLVQKLGSWSELWKTYNNAQKKFADSVDKKIKKLKRKN